MTKGRVGAQLEHQPDAALAARLDARFRAPLMSFFLRRTGNRQDAEDLTQEVFLRVLRRGEEPPGEFAEVFIFKIAANLWRLAQPEARPAA